MLLPGAAEAQAEALVGRRGVVPESHALVVRFDVPNARPGTTANAIPIFALNSKYLAQANFQGMHGARLHLVLVVVVLFVESIYHLYLTAHREWRRTCADRLEQSFCCRL